MVAKGKGGRGGLDGEFGTSRCKLFYMGWINNKVLLYSTGNYIQYPVINHNGKEYEKEKTKPIPNRVASNNSCLFSSPLWLGNSVWAQPGSSSGLSQACSCIWVSYGASGSWLVQDVLSWDNSTLLRMISHPPAGEPGQSQGLKRASRSVQGLWKPGTGLGTGTPSHSIGQRKSQEQSRING